MLAIMLEMTRPLRCFWYLSAYSIAEQPAPRLPQKDEIVGSEAEGLADLLDFLDEPVDVHERGSAGWSL